VRVRKLSLQDFRNIGFTALDFVGQRQFFVGANGQGKTNLLEALGFLTALRSFRTSDNKVLIAHGKPEAAIACELTHERLGDTTVTVRLRADQKEVWIDQTRVARLSEYVGQFPTVVFSSHDIQLVRGAPALRRRWLDLTLAAMDAAYLRSLQVYARALADRNALLKRGRTSPDEFQAFERALAPAAADLIRRRQEGVAWINQALQRAYQTVAGEAESAAIAYDPDFAAADEAALLGRLDSTRNRDAQFRTTLTGPHRDDLAFTVKSVPAKEFASEGQQRSFVLAVRLAQAAWFEHRSGVRPVLLADDVLGELDAGRRQRFWSAINPDSQVIATGTHLPAAELGTWQTFAVEGGAVRG
jgi:DNA replication and repair protein RecF